MRFRACVGALLLAVSAYAQAAGPAIHGTVKDESGLPLPGVTVSLLVDGTQQGVTSTDGIGDYTLEVPAGRYTVRVELPGFEPVDRSDIVISADGADADFVLHIATVTESVVVVAPEAPVLPSKSSAPQTINRAIIDTAPFRTGRFDDVLPLLPNVIRGPDGLISVAGARAPQGSLLVNGVRETDPVTGASGVTLPIEAVQSIEMRASSYGADLDGAAGGVTSVHTEPGTDDFRVRVNSLDPRLKINHGSITGIDAWEPHAAIRGPIVKGKAWFSESLDYRFSRDRYDTIFGREQRLLYALLSWSQVDMKLSNGHTVSSWATIYPENTDAANVTAFTTTDAVANARRGGWSSGALDRVLFTNASLETRLQVKRLDSAIAPQSVDGTYQVAPDRISGGYFDTRDRSAYRTEASTAYTTWAGQHTIKVGGSYGYVTFSGTDVSRPVEWLRSDGSLARRQTFVGAGQLGASAFEASAFVQDEWAVLPRLSLSLGARVDANSTASAPVLAPRGAFSYLFADDRTTLSGAAGLYVDKLVLAAQAFAGLPARVEQAFDGGGRPIGPPTIFTNTIDGALDLPSATLFNLQLDRRFGDRWLTRIRYQERHGIDEMIVTPRLTSAYAGELALSSTGSSLARSVETTVGYRIGSGTQAYVSYVRSTSRGNLNDLNAIDGDYKTALILPDAEGPLAADAPHRLLTWGIFNLPRAITVAPFFEWRTGFPFTALDEDWTIVGARNDQRFPAFASLDLVVTKTLVTPFLHLPARIGVKVYNIAGRKNGRDVQADIERPDFGQTFNPLLRQLRGVFEIEWGK